MSALSEHDKAILNCVFNPNLPLNIPILEPVDLEETSELVKTTKAMELEAINLAEKGDVENAVNALNKALEMAPDRASIFNNRAHCYQFLAKIPEALQDLNQAITLASGTELKKTLAQAYNQRGLINKKLERFEEARNDFEKAAEIGSQFAKNQLVEMNPYAALCNQMLRKVMDTLA